MDPGDVCGRHCDSCCTHGGENDDSVGAGLGADPGGSAPAQVATPMAGDCLVGRGSMVEMKISGSSFCARQGRGRVVLILVVVLAARVDLVGGGGRDDL